MSIENVLEDVVTGDFSDAEKRIGQWWSGVLPEIEAEFKVIASAEGQILQGLAKTAAQDVISGGLTTASFVAAVKDITTKLIAQEIKLGTQTVYTVLNAIVSQQVAIAEPVTTGPLDAAIEAVPAIPAE